MNNDEREVLDDFDDFEKLLNDVTFSENLSDNIKSSEDNVNITKNNNTIDNFENSNNTNIENNQNQFDGSTQSIQPAENDEIIVEKDLNKENEKIQEKQDLENPIVEMVNNKTTMKLIIVMLVVLFVAVMFMPTVINYIKDLINK